MDVKLIVMKGPARTRTVPVRTAETLVGRQRGCKIRIPSAEVSRRHCILSFREGQLFVEDLNSANGTFINNERITGKRTLLPGDHLTIGPLMFAVEYELGAGTEKAAPEPEHAVPAPAADAPIPLAEPKAEEDEVFDLVLDDSEPMNLPQGEAFRDFLGKMER